MIDIFSCKEFDSKQAEQELLQLFSLGEIKSWTLERGLEYLDEPHARREVALDRETIRQQW